jgi:hypothetical protein
MKISGFLESVGMAGLVAAKISAAISPSQGALHEAATLRLRRDVVRDVIRDFRGQRALLDPSVATKAHPCG